MPAHAAEEMTLGGRPVHDVLVTDKAGSMTVLALQGGKVPPFFTDPFVRVGSDWP